MATIKNIIFDFGNVLFDIDIPKIRENLHLHFGDRAETALQRIREQGLFDLYEVGGISTEDFVETLRTAGGTPHLTAEQVVDAWNSIFIEMPRPRFDFLLGLREGYKVFLLSNINDLHERWIADYMVRQHGIHDYERGYFDGVYMSHLIHLRKPDRAIYEYVLADAQIEASESVFFDDLKVNVEAASEVGIRGIWHPPGTEIITHVARVI